MKLRLAVLAALTLAGCSGGGVAAIPAASSAPSSNSAAATPTSLKITIPNAGAPSAHARTPAFVSASTKSVIINVTPHLSTTPVTGFPMTENLTSTSPGCAGAQSGTVCVIQLALVPGAYDATLSTFDGLNGTGNQLSAAQDHPFTVVLNQANILSFVLGGIATSMQITAGTGVTAGHLSVYDLTGSTSGAIDAYGVDVDGNIIIGAGGPTITATTSDATQIAVSAPSATAPNAIGVSALTSSAIARITATVTPAAGVSGATFTQTVIVQAAAVPLLYIASSQGHVFDLTGTEITPANSAFTTAFSSAGGVGMVYDPANGFLYATNYNLGVGSILAFDRSGNQQTLSAAAAGLPPAGGIALNPNNGYLYVAGLNVAFDASGNTHALASTLPYAETMAFDPQNNYVIDGTETFDAAGTQHAAYPFTGQIFGGVAYNAFNGLFYVATVYPTLVTAYDASGTPQILSGTFINNSSEDIGGIVADPATGNIYVATNYHNTYGFTANGNPLPAPWHTITTVGASSGAAGLVLAPP